MSIRILRDLLCIAAVSISATLVTVAKNAHPALGEAPAPGTQKSGLEFIENKGQWNPEAKFKASLPASGTIFITDKGFVYNYSSAEDLDRIHNLTHHTDQSLPTTIEDEIVRHHAYRVIFEGANQNITYETGEKKSAYHNYFIGNDPSKWASDVPLFGKIIQKNVYQGIDVALYSNDWSLKYDFIVKAGADPEIINLSFKGVSPVITPDGDLEIKTSINQIIEKAPYVYQVIDGKEHIVPSKYVLKNGILSFAFPKGYDKRYDLIIDPELVFATYSGGIKDANYSLATTYDNMGNMYAGAYAYGNGWPVTDGAIQSAYSGGVDVAVNKYNDSGTRLIYSTFYGGTMVDLPHAMIVNEQGELIIAGSTTSNNLATTKNCFSSTLKGGGDVFVAHFNATGTALLGATYIGGNTLDPVAFTFRGGATYGLQNQNTISPVEVNYDQSGNIWVVGSTGSSDFPVTDNAHQKTLAGAQDGFIFQMDPTCSRLIYSSFLGGSSSDCISAIQFNNENNVVICGTTLSNNFPVTANALNGTFKGGFSDGFAAVINSKTGAIVSCTYLGTDNVDKAINLQVDRYTNSVYVLGQTLGDYPITPGVYSMKETDVFIDKLSADMSKSLLSTRIGTALSQNVRYFPTAFLLDNCENIYVAGLGGADGSSLLPATMPVTSDAFSTRADNFYFIALKPAFEDILFGSYYGSPVDDHTHCGVNRLDPDGKVYHSVCSAASGGDAFPTTPGVYAPKKQNSGQDIVSFKFDFEASGVRADFKVDADIGGNDSGCVPYTVQFQSISKLAADLLWDFGDGSPFSSTTNPTHTFTKTGTYTVTLYASNDTTCVTGDTAQMTITVLSTEKPDIVVEDVLLCHYEQQIDLGITINNPSPNHVFSWGPSTGLLSDPDKPSVKVEPSVNNVYYVTVTDTIPGVCGKSTTDTIHIDLSPRELRILNKDTTVCEGSTVYIAARATPGYELRWRPAIGVSDTTILEPEITVHQSNVYTLTGSYPGCLDTTVSIEITMEKNPMVNLGPDISVCEGEEVALEAKISPFRNDYIYKWTPDEGLNNANTPNADLIAKSSETYRFEARTPIGCAATSSIRVVVYPGKFGQASEDTSFCPPYAVPIWASGGIRYNWVPAAGLSDPNIANPMASPLSSTTYTVYITDLHGCQDSQFVHVEVHPQAVLALPDSVNIYPGEQYQIEPATNAVYFNWFPPSGLSSVSVANPVASPEVRTRYYVEAATEHGCVIKDSIDILVSGTIIDMPNAFSPSGVNKVFKPSKRGIAQLVNFSVFNRWGTKVFSTTNIEEGWDGTFNGKPQPLGVYIYVIDAITDSGRTFNQKGNVTLLK